MTIETAMEAKLIALRRSVKDGVVISFAIHPNDISRDLLSADLGTVFGLGLKELNPETGTVKEAPAPAPVKPKRERKPEGDFDSLPLVKQAGILCADTEFQAWITRGWRGPGNWTPEERAADVVRTVCGVKSRTEFDNNSAAGRQWRKAVEDFRAWQKDRRAEERARQQAEVYAR